MKIVIVDDKKENLYLLEQTMATSGHEVVTANNGAEALTILRAQKCDLIISDILMPVMDGFQLCKHVKADHQLKTVPFIFYTATYTDKKDEEFALALGADKFIRKPTEPEAFLEIVKKIASDKPKACRTPIPPNGPLIEEKEVFKLYSERLVDKLERKMIVLDREMRERKQAEEALRRTEMQLHQLQKIEALGTLSAGIAHDFNNILGAILGYTELAILKASPQGDIHQTLQQVLKAGHRAKELVKHILTFSRQVEQKRKPTDLHLVIKEALTLLRATLPSTIIIQEHISAEPAMVLADSTQIHQVIMNLGTNAEHALREKGGTLEVRLDRVDLPDHLVEKHSHYRPGPYLRLSVHDTGHGIPPEIQNRIFEPFFTTKDIGEGTGMGLAVVHGIVTNHDGIITVESLPGQGTTFVIYLPWIDAGVTLEAGESLPPQPRRACVMFVDDEEPLVQLGLRMLHELGHEAIVCSGSVAALQVFRENPNRYDVVVTDQTMPHLTGETLTRELLQIRPNLPIILCTGFSSTLTPEKARSLGIQDYLMKPILIKELALALKNALEKNE